jgi:hypothetical protein
MASQVASCDALPLSHVSHTACSKGGCCSISEHHVRSACLPTGKDFPEDGQWIPICLIDRNHGSL